MSIVETEKTICKPNYTFSVKSDGQLKIFSQHSEYPFIQSKRTPYLPITSKGVAWGDPEVEYSNEGGHEVIRYKLKTNNLYEDPTVTFILKDKYIELFFTGKVKTDMYVNRWNFFAKKSIINAIDVLNFESHIDSPVFFTTNQTILSRRKLGTVGLDINTDDSDLMFSPHPMLFVFNNFKDQMIIAPMGLVNAHYMTLKMYKGSTTVRNFQIIVGDNIYPLKSGEMLESTHYMLTFNEGEKQQAYECLAQYTNYLVEDNIIKPKTEEDMVDWWYSPMWCSWGDQHIFDGYEVVKLADTNEKRLRIVNNINDKTIQRSVDIIKENDLPIRTLIVDDRWYTYQGDMKVDTSKFPDLRGSVDRLHDDGFKVIAWASLYKFEEESEVFQKHPEWFLLHHFPYYSEYEKGMLFLNYADEKIAKTYLTELLERLLSDGPGCYNFDGIKFDWPFLVPHNYPHENRDWVGKEKPVYYAQKTMHDIAKSIKKDALIIGVSPHPFFNDTQDIIRTYDILTFDPTIHLDRAKYIKSIAPGMVPAMDEHVFYQNLEAYLQEGINLGIPMFYNLVMMHGDDHIFTAENYQKIREILLQYVDSKPKLKTLFKKLNVVK